MNNHTFASSSILEKSFASKIETEKSFASIRNNEIWFESIQDGFHISTTWLAKFVSSTMITVATIANSNITISSANITTGSFNMNVDRLLTLNSVNLSPTFILQSNITAPITMIQNMGTVNFNSNACIAVNLNENIPISGVLFNSISGSVPATAIVAQYYLLSDFDNLLLNDLSGSTLQQMDYKII